MLLYQHIRQANFLSRPNRFIAHCLLDGTEVVCHVKNTGRCRELLTEHAVVYLEENNNPARKTKYDLVAVQKGDLLINMDSAAPNHAAGEWLRDGGLLPSPELVRPELTHGDSRFDFYMETGDKKAFVEVKGVTLEEHGMALFPDAPTQRGVKHINGLAKCVAEGFAAYLLFVIQLNGITAFAPNDKTDPAFGEALRRAAAAGVQLIAMDCTVTPDTMTIANPVDILLP